MATTKVIAIVELRGWLVREGNAEVVEGKWVPRGERMRCAGGRVVLTVDRDLTKRWGVGQGRTSGGGRTSINELLI
jgi:hypothetical protein